MSAIGGLQSHTMVPHLENLALQNLLISAVKHNFYFEAKRLF